VAAGKPKSILKNEYVKTLIAIGLVVVVVLGGYFVLGVALGTDTPIRVVESGSMCTTVGGCDGFSDVFTHTLHIGDLIIIQKINPTDYNVNYPNSDIIVYQNPELSGSLGATPIVHRIAARYEVNGTYYFQTKGDGNGIHWPANITSGEYDSKTLWASGQGTSQDHVLGRVVMRIPYIGWTTLLMRNTFWALPIVIALIFILVIAEFVLPALKPKPQPKKSAEEQKQTATEP
jgi:signal peptidase I